MIIRRARPDDIDALFEITRDSFLGLAAGHYSQAQMDGWMDGCSPATYLEGVEAGRVHVAEVDGRVVGYVEALPGEVLRLFVLPTAAGRGLGRELMELGIRMAREGHGGPVALESLRNAVAFYERLGFVTVGPGYASHGAEESPPIEVVRMELPAG